MASELRLVPNLLRRLLPDFTPPASAVLLPVKLSRLYSQTWLYVRGHLIRFTLLPNIVIQ